jgi:hypothetical protein
MGSAEIAVGYLRARGFGEKVRVGGLCLAELESLGEPYLRFEGVFQGMD